jgi:hypothetical protein
LLLQTAELPKIVEQVGENVKAGWLKVACKLCM